MAVAAASSIAFVLPFAVVLAFAVFVAIAEWRFQRRRTRGIELEVTPGRPRLGIQERRR